MTTNLKEELDRLHSDYVEAVNLAVEADDLPRAVELAASYDHEAIALIASREGVSPAPAPAPTDELSLRRRLVRRLTHRHAA